MFKHVKLVSAITASSIPILVFFAATGNLVACFSIMMVYSVIILVFIVIDSKRADKEYLELVNLKYSLKHICEECAKNSDTEKDNEESESNG